MVEGVARFISGAKMDDVLLSRVDGDWVWKREEGGEMSGDEDAGLHREMGRTGEEEADLCRVWLRSGTGDVETCGWLDRRERGKELDYPRGRCRVAHRVSGSQPTSDSNSPIIAVTRLPRDVTTFPPPAV